MSTSYLRELAENIRDAAGPPTSNDDLVYLIYAVLARSKGTSVTAEDVHDAWIAAAEYHQRSHDDMIPYSSLSEETQQKDDRFVAAIHAVARPS